MTSSNLPAKSQHVHENRGVWSGEVRETPQIQWNRERSKSIAVLRIAIRAGKFSTTIQAACHDELAERASKLLPGSFVRVTGALVTRIWVDRETTRSRYYVEVYVQQLEVLAEQLPLTPDYDRDAAR